MLASEWLVSLIESASELLRILALDVAAAVVVIVVEVLVCCFWLPLLGAGAGMPSDKYSPPVVAGWLCCGR